MMNLHAIVSRLSSTMVFSALCVAAPAFGQAAKTALPVVKVIADHYEASGKRFADIEQLAAWVESTGARGLVLHSCMSSSTKPLVAAIERLQNVYLDVRWSLAGESGCPAERTTTAQTAPR